MTQEYNETNPAIKPKLEFKKTNRQNTCPCCNNNHGCKLGFAGIEIQEVWCLRTIGPNDAPEGWMWVRSLSDGMGSRLVLKGSGIRPRNYHWEDKIGGDRTIEKISPLRVLSRQERDFFYQPIWASLDLSEEHKAQLQGKRGLTDEEIEWAGFRTWIPNKSCQASGNLPGVNLRGNRLVGTRGFAIPCKDPKGRITGFQIANDDAERHGKYTWGSSVRRANGVNVGGNGPQLINGEMPIACWVPRNAKLGIINLCEGGLKSAIAAAKLGEIFLGCASNAHYGPSTLNQYLKEIASLPGFEKPRIRLWPDAGAVENRGGIPHGNFKALRMCQHWGYKIEVAWWGQTTKSHHPDVDELLLAGRGEEVEFIAPDDFINLHTPAIRERLLQKEFRAGLRVGDTPALSPFPRDSKRECLEYSVGDRAGVWQAIAQERKYILDTSGTGTGKSHTIGEMNPEDFGALQLVYVSADHRNVTTPTLQEWPDLQGRHGGLIWIDGPEGTKQLRRATKYDTPDIKPNCDRHRLAEILPSRNTPGTGEFICQGCKHRKTCRDGSGEFSFIFDRQNILKESRYRAHPASLDPKTFVGTPEDPNTVLVIDEADRLEFTHSFVVRPKDVRRAIEQVAERQELIMVRNYLEYLLGLMNEKLPLHGYNHEAILECLPPVPELDMMALEEISEQNLEFLEPGWVPPEYGGGTASDYPKEVRALVRQTVDELTSRADEVVDLRWMPEFFRCVSGEGRLRLSPEGLRITIKNQHLLSVLSHPHVKSIIFLDATGAAEHLELWLGEEVAWIEGKMPEQGADVSITQVAGLKLMGFNRGAAQARRAEALVNELLERHPDAGVIDSSTSARLREKDGYWFRESRGSNAFQNTNTLILIGAPIANIGTMADEYALATGRSPGSEMALRTYPIYAKNTKAFYSRTLRESADEGFAQWVRWRTLGEMEQAIGRLRGNRRTGEKLKIYLLSDYPLDREVELVGIEALAPKAMEAIAAQNPEPESVSVYSVVSSNAIENNNSAEPSHGVLRSLSATDIEDIDAILSEFLALGLPPDFDSWLMGMSPSERHFVWGRARSRPEWSGADYWRKKEISKSMYAYAMRA